MFIASAAVAGCGVLIDDPAGYCRGKTENYSVAWSMVGQPANVVVEIYGKPANAKPRGGGCTELMFRKRGSIYQNSPTHFIVGPDGRCHFMGRPRNGLLRGVRGLAQSRLSAGAGVRMGS